MSNHAVGSVKMVSNLAPYFLSEKCPQISIFLTDDMFTILARETDTLLLSMT